MENGIGSKGFGPEYWKKNYYCPSEMDGIGNAKEHAKYLKCLLSLDFVEVDSIVDLGMGMGHLLKEMIKTFRPKKAIGVEPSDYAFNKAKKKILNLQNPSYRVTQNDLIKFLEKQKNSKQVYDLGICTSVFQYLTKEEIVMAIPLIAQRVKYLYFSVPTDKELLRQKEDVDFHDAYAFARSKNFYKKVIGDSFTFISSRLLESKNHFNESNTLFTELLYRF
ncbi:MAG: class I SAM-dependent methyltransferase [Bdellovibrionales bacterium]|nr:class I SAM-dependent methyltransferase [Bdellovibrionales bacterium]